MHLLKILTNVVFRGVSEMEWKVLASFVAIYLSLNYVGFTLFGEVELVSSFHQFMYYMVISISTVGYGDYSPVTTPGKIFATYLTIPLGLGIFASLLGKASATIIGRCTRRLHGEHRIMQHQHIVIVGYNARTQFLVKQIQQESASGQLIALCVDHNAPEKNPFTDLHVEYFRSTSLTDTALYERASVAHAAKVLVDVEDDSETNLVCMHLATITNDTCVITAYVKNEMVGNLLEAHCPRVNIIPSLHQQMLVKAAVDPGSEEVIRKLVDVSHGQTQYSTRIPADWSPLCVEEMATRLRKNCKASVIAIRQAGDAYPMLNPDYDTLIQPGDEVYYIAKQRLAEGDFSQCCA